MAKPLTMRQESDEHALIASAVRTLEAEAGGISALMAAIDNGLGRSFTAAIELIRGVSGRVIVTGMGKSGHVGRKIAATLASTGTPAFFVHPSEASHGFTAIDFGRFHPGGRLGAKLKFVRDIMHTGAELPLCPIGTRMSEAIPEMTAKTFACIGIVDGGGGLVGIITDGDLRRHMG